MSDNKITDSAPDLAAEKLPDKAVEPGMTELPRKPHQDRSVGNEPRASYLWALAAEIRILIRAIANDPNKRVSDITFKWLDEDGVTQNYSYAMMVVELANLATAQNATKQMLQLGLLQAVKDQLVERTAPATGLTIAYTSLVVGEQRHTGAESTYALAQQAYGNLKGTARHLRLLVIALSMLALLLATFAAWEATKASLGKNLLQVLEPLRAQQAVIASDRFKLEMTLEKDGPVTPVPTGMVLSTDMDTRLLPVCDRHWFIESRIKDRTTLGGIHLDPSASVRELCGRDFVLAHDFLVAHSALQQYMESWPDIAGGMYSVVGRLVHRLLSGMDRLLSGMNPEQHTVSSLEPQYCSDSQIPELGDRAKLRRLVRCSDVEFLVAPTVQVISNYTLPFIFGVIGSLLYVLLQHYGSVRATTVHPHDLALAYLRVTLGIVVAACISLLVTSYAGGTAIVGPGGVPSTGSLAGSLTLSASGLTFLAGFGAEAVFTLLQNFVARVFVLPK